MIFIYFIIEIMGENFVQGMLLSKIPAANVHGRQVSYKN